MTGWEDAPGLGEKRLLGEPEQRRGCPLLSLLPIPRARAQPSTGCRASGSWMHGAPAIRPRSGAADSSFLSRAAPFSLCLPAAPADAAADEQTRRARQHSRPAPLSPGRHRHGSFKSRLFRSKSSPGYQQRAAGWLPAPAPAGCVMWAVGFRMPRQPGLGSWAPRYRAMGCCSSHQRWAERLGHGWAGDRPGSTSQAPAPALGVVGAQCHLALHRTSVSPRGNGISTPGKAPRTPETHPTQEKVGHGQAKPCSPTLGYLASGGGASRMPLHHPSFLGSMGVSAAQWVPVPVDGSLEGTTVSLVGGSSTDTAAGAGGDT